VVTEEDLGAQFFVSEADIGKNVSLIYCHGSTHSNTSQRAEAAAPEVQKLNPRVNVNVVTRDVRNEQLPSFYKSFDIIIATDIDFLSLTTLNAGARIAERPFYAGGTHGFYGYIFADLITHSFVIEREKSNKATTKSAETATRSIIDWKDKVENGKKIEMVTKQELYTPLMLANTSPLAPDMQKDPRKLRKVHPLLTCIRTLWDYQRHAHRTLPSHSPADLQQFTSLAMEKHKELLLPASTLTADFLRDFIGNLGSEIAPVTAYLGGQLAQDVINVLGKREQPIQNLMLFDGENYAAPVYSLHPIFPDNPVPVVPIMPIDAPVLID
jgi:ubiquitin-like 1-activating enzyme E1 A